jgi:hypothetical protein
MRRPARAIGAETAPELRTVAKTGNEAVEAPQSVAAADPFPWRRHEPAAPEGTGGTRSRTVPPQSGRAVGSLVSGKRELREAGRCLKVLKLRTALAAIKFAARMTNRGERGRSVPPHAISPAVYYAAASLSAAKSVAETTRSTWSPAGNSRIEMPGGHQGNRRGTGAGILTIELPSDSTAHQRAARIDRSGIRGARYAATTNLRSATRRDKTCSNRSVRTVSKKASQLV